MPIEIRELVIRATVEQGNNEGESRSETQSSRGGQGSNELIARIDELKKIIQEKNER